MMIVAIARKMMRRTKRIKRNSIPHIRRQIPVFLILLKKIKDKKDEKHFILTVHRCQRKEKTRKNASTQATILARLEGEKDEENELILL